MDTMEMWNFVAKTKILPPPAYSEILISCPDHDLQSQECQVEITGEKQAHQKGNFSCIHAGIYY